VIPDQDVAVHAVRFLVRLIASIGNPIVVVGGAHLMQEAVFQRPSDTNNKDDRMLLQNRALTLFPWEIGIHRQDFFGVQLVYTRKQSSVLD